MTSERDQVYARYCSLRDRQAAGAVLTEEEVAFCEQMERDDPACQHEHAFLAELGDMAGTPSDAARALVAATMDAIAEGALDTGDRPGDSERERPSRGPIAAVVLAVAAAAAALTMVWLSSGSEQQPPAQAHKRPTPAPEAPRRVELVYSSGATHVDGIAPDLEPASSTTLLEGGQRLAASEGGLCLVMDPGINVCLDAHSELVLSQTTGAQQRLELLRGRVALALDPQPRGYDVTVVAAGVESTAIGTVFSVAMDETGIRTSVLEGKVRVAADGQSALVRAHERHLVSEADRTTKALSRRDEAPEWAMVDATRLWRGRLSGTLSVRGQPIGAEVWLDGRQIGVTPLSSLIPAGHHRVEVRAGSGVLLDQPIELSAGRRATVRYAPPEPLEVPARVVRRRPQPELPADQMPSTETLLSEARRLMLEGRFQQAALTYRALRVAHPQSPEASMVLVPLAELELDRLGEPKRALALVDDYLRQGRGAMRHEALYLRTRALRRLGRLEEEREAIGALLDAHPGSFHAERLRQRLAELDR